MKALPLDKPSSWEPKQTYAEHVDFDAVLSAEGWKIQQRAICEANLDRYRDLIKVPSLNYKGLAPCLYQTNGAMLRRKPLRSKRGYL
jgi:hypothetical protein